MGRTEPSIGSGAAAGGMKLLFLNHNVAYSGTFFRAFNIARQLAGVGHEVTLVTTSRAARFAARSGEVDGVRLVQAPDLFWGPARTGWDPWNTLRRIGLLRGAEFDLVHGFDCRPAVILPALAIQRRTGAALFLDWADWWGRGGTIQERSGRLVRTLFGPIETWFEEAFRTRATASTVISGALRRRLLGLGVPETSILQVPNGCDLEGIRPLDRALARGRLAVDPGARLIAHLGVLTRADAKLLCDAFRLVRQHVPEARLVLVGRSPAGIPGDLLASGAVVRTGFVSFDDVRLWLGAADLCVVSLADTIGNHGRWPGKINDYFSAGRATVLPRVGDAASLVDETGTGWTAESAPASFAEAIAQALSRPEALAHAGARARRLAEDRLSWARTAAAVERFYHSTLSASRRPVSR